MLYITGKERLSHNDMRLAMYDILDTDTLVLHRISHRELIKSIEKGMTISNIDNHTLETSIESNFLFDLRSMKSYKDEDIVWMGMANIHKSLKSGFYESKYCKSFLLRVEDGWLNIVVLIEDMLYNVKFVNRKSDLLSTGVWEFSVNGTYLGYYTRIPFIPVFDIESKCFKICLGITTASEYGIILNKNGNVVFNTSDSATNINTISYRNDSHVGVVADEEVFYKECNKLKLRYLLE